MSNEDSPTFIVLTIDGINSFMLGLYGNTTLETSAFDRIAAGGITFDFAFSHSCELKASLHKLLEVGEADSITRCVAGRSMMVTDCAVATECAREAQFESIVDLSDQATGNRIANNIGETRAASFFSTALESVEPLQPGDLLWCHFSGLNQQWDAPLEFRNRFVGPDDPEAYDRLEPPHQAFDAEVDDPDLLVSIQAALTAQVAVIDQLLEVFLDFIEQHPVASQAHLVVTSPRGYSLGSDGQIGIGQSLTSESVHVPLLVSVSGQARWANLRSHCLVQNSLVVSLIDRLSEAASESGQEFLDRHCAVFMDDQTRPIFLAGAKEHAIQNRFWKLVRHAHEDGEVSWRLYVKPDDRWDANDVSTRCPQVVEELGELIGNAQQIR